MTRPVFSLLFMAALLVGLVVWLLARPSVDPEVSIDPSTILIIDTPIQPPAESSPGANPASTQQSGPTGVRNGSQSGLGSNDMEQVVSLGVELDAEQTGYEYSNEEVVELGEVMNVEDYGTVITDEKLVNVGEPLNVDDHEYFSADDSGEAVFLGEDMDVETYLNAYDAGSELELLGPQMSVEE